MTVHETLAMRHGRLWMVDAWYRAACLLGPQFVGLAALAWLFASPSGPQAPPPPSVPGHWMHPIHSAEELASLRQLRDQAVTDPAARAQLEHQALAGNSLAQFFAGTLNDPSLHFHGDNPPDPAKALRDYRLAADQGVDVAAVNLGILLLAEQNTGAPKDFTEARRLFERAAPTAAIGTRELGIMKKNGWGEPMDPAGGMAMIRTAAERGEAGAERIVGLAYDLGDSVYPRDVGQAINWLRKAADQGDARSQRQLGFHYKMGDGVAADEATALDWFKKAAALGDASAKAQVDAAAAAKP